MHGGEHWHRHVHLVGGSAAANPAYPAKLCIAIPKGCRNQLLEDGKCDKNEIGPVYFEVPVINEHFDLDTWYDFSAYYRGDKIQFYDDASGAPLIIELQEDRVCIESASERKLESSRKGTHRSEMRHGQQMRRSEN